MGRRLRHPRDDRCPEIQRFHPPLIFYKRLSDVFDDEFTKQIEEFGDEDIAREIIDADHQDALKTGRNPIVRFYIPQEYRWEALRDSDSFASPDKSGMHRGNGMGL